MDTLFSRIKLRTNEKVKRSDGKMADLTKAQLNRAYTISEIKTPDEELKNFLFTLGCYEGENVTVLSILAENYVISVKDARYSIDKNLAKAIIV
jgi:Fe2+ transport system protein FeoA